MDIVAVKKVILALAVGVILFYVISGIVFIAVIGRILL